MDVKKTWQGDVHVDKEEILKKSRNENKNRDYVEKEAVKNASVIAFIVGCSVCIVVCAIQWFFTETINYGCWLVNFSILGTVFLLKYIKMKTRRELAFTIIFFLFFLLYLVGFILSLRG